MIVGYKDRFIGTIETPFKTLDWESDIASVGKFDKLVIPQHRIEYFKYQGRVVWDKKNRVDHVFGSTGDSITIRDVISQIENGESSKDVPKLDHDANDEEANQPGMSKEVLFIFISRKML